MVTPDLRPAPEAAVPAPPVLPNAHVPWQAPGALRRLASILQAEPGDLVVLFVSPLADTYRVAKQAEQAFDGITIVGCTTAGEISGEGYTSSEIVAVRFPKAWFRCETILINDLGDMDQHDLAYRTLKSRSELERQCPGWDTEFAFTLIDGLSLAEDIFMGALAQTMGPVPLFGGSAGDDIDFHQAFVIHGGQAYNNAAVLVLVRSLCRVQVFKLDHLIPSGAQMVVTGADPSARVVYEINAEPAGREYARILQKDPDQLSPMTFAAHPVLVRIGDQHHVRAIQRVNDDGHLVFFSAIDEGVVLSLAEAMPIVSHLDEALTTLSRPQKPAQILAFDCILRRIEAEQNQTARPLSDVLARHNVIGFNTFGEQYHGTHVNQTMTGAAIYPPEV